MDLFVMTAIAVLSAMTGFWLGRSITWQLAGTESGISLVTEEENAPAKPRFGEGIHLQYREICSPVSGEISAEEEGGRKRISIRPLKGKLYAPASGKITRLYPMGRSMVLRADFGAEILITVGERVDEMFSDCYRCRIMENEIVRKGSLLLEFAPECLAEKGADPKVTLRVENEELLGPLTYSDQGRVKAGEPILYVACDKKKETYERLY